MKDNINRRFISFNMLIIGIISTILCGVVYWGSKSTVSPGRLILSVLLMLVMTFAGSILLSRFASRPIREAWQKQLDFTADASHELRTPLAVVRTSLELVMDNPGETVESQMKWLKNIEAENYRMARLVDDLLTLSRADARQHTLNRSTFMLDELLEDITASILPLAGHKGITLTFHSNAGTAIHADKERIKQLIVILLDNALQYTEPGGCVTLTLSRTKESADILIADTGAGIPKEDLGKIFNRFFRGANTRSMHQDGSGLGLSIASWIVTEHQGKISAESTPGEGSRFLIRLPFHLS